MFSLQASEDQIREAKKTSAKSKAKPTVVPPTSLKKSGEKHVRSPQKPDQVSPNPGAAKRLRGKQENPDQSQQIEELQEACVDFFSLSLSLSPSFILWNLLIVSDVFGHALTYQSRSYFSVVCSPLYPSFCHLGRPTGA